MALDELRCLYDAADSEAIDHIVRGINDENISEDEDTDADDEEYEEVMEVPKAISDVGSKLIPFGQLKAFVESNCCCRHCHAKIEVTQETFGLATNLCLLCESREEDDGRRTTRHKATMMAERINPTPQHDSGSNYISNFMLMIAMQMLGLGVQSTTVFLGLLGMRPSLGNTARWKKIQEEIGRVQEQVAKEVMEENQDRAIQAALDDGVVPSEEAGGRIGLTTSIDGGWQKRSSGKQYDSPSGHNLLVDCRTKLVLARKVYSKLCATCFRHERKQAASSEQKESTDGDNDIVNSSDEEGDVPEPRIIEQVKDHRCPRNYEGSSKAMESYGAVDLVTQLWQSPKNIWAKTIIGDDDSTSRAALTIDLAQYGVDHPDEPKDSYWPRNPDKDGKKGSFVDNKGKLHWSMTPPSTFLCDPTHRTRVVGSKLFELAGKSGTTLVTRADALRLKRNYGYAHKQARGKPFNEYKIAMESALYHHGNDHQYCDPAWCRYAAGTKDPAENKRSVLIGTVKWHNLEKVHKKYTTNDMLQMCHHEFDSQKNESLNTRIATYAPKNKTFSYTKSLEDRIDLVIIIDSIGYSSGITRIITRLTGRTATLSPVQRLWLANQDKLDLRKKQYKSMTSTKKARAKRVQERIKQSVAEDKKAARRGMYYGSGIAVEGETPPLEALQRQLKEEEAKKQQKKELAALRKERKDKGLCIYCGGSDHKKRTSTKCGEHQQYLEEKAKKSEKKRKVEGPNKNSDVGEGETSVDNQFPVSV